jgi:hypothetical protein
MFGLPSLPVDAFPVVAFGLATMGIIVAKIWSRALDRWEHQDKSAGTDLGLVHAPATSQVKRPPRS